MTYKELKDNFYKRKKEEEEEEKKKASESSSKKSSSKSKEDKTSYRVNYSDIKERNQDKVLQKNLRDLDEKSKNYASYSENSYNNMDYSNALSSKKNNSSAYNSLRNTSDSVRKYYEDNKSKMSLEDYDNAIKYLNDLNSGSDTLRESIRDKSSALLSSFASEQEYKGYLASEKKNEELKKANVDELSRELSSIDDHIETLKRDFKTYEDNYKANNGIIPDMTTRNALTQDQIDRAKTYTQLKSSTDKRIAELEKERSDKESYLNEAKTVQADTLYQNSVNEILKNPDYNNFVTSGKTSYENDVATQNQLEEDNKEEESFFDKLGRYLGEGGGTTDTSLPTSATTNVINAEYQGLGEDYKYGVTDKWTLGQKSNFYAIYSQDKELAKEYAYKTNLEIKQNETAGTLQKINEWSEQNALTGILGTAAGIVTSAFAGDKALLYLTEMNSKGYIDDYTKASLTYSDISSAFQSGVAKGIEEATNGNGTMLSDVLSFAGQGASAQALKMSGNDTPLSDFTIKTPLGDIKFGNVYSKLYNTGFSALQSYAIMSTLGPAGTLALGSGAASSTMDDALDRGLSNDQAVTLGVLSGIFEGLFEELSFDKLINIENPANIAQALKNTLIQGGVEASEETFTAIANTVADLIVSGDKSEIATNIATYMAMGMDESSANKQAILDFLSGLIDDAMGGFLSGGAMASVSQLAGVVSESYRTGVLYGDSASELVAEGLLSAQGTNSRALAEANQKKLDAGKKLSNSDIYKQVRANEEAFKNETVNTVDNALNTSESTASRDSNKTPVETARSASEDILRDNIPQNTNTTSNSNTVTLDNGEKSHVNKFESIDKNNVMVKLDNGQTVNSKDIDFDSDSTAVLFKALGNTVYSTEDANQLLNIYKTTDNLSVEDYLSAVNEAYTYGKIGVKDLPADGYSSVLTPTQKQSIYNMGNKAATISKAVKEETRKANKVTGQKRIGKVTYMPSVTSLTDIQTNSLLTIERVTQDILNDEVVIYASKEENGQRVVTEDIDGVLKAGDKAPNGFYDSSTGKIYIDLNAGQNGEGTMLWTFAHEATHYAQDNAGKSFDNLANFLIEEYGKKDVSVSDLINAQIEKAANNGRDIGVEEAFSEVLADSMQTMFTDTDVMNKLAKLKKLDKGAWATLKEFFINLLENIKALYSKLNPETREAQLVSSMKDSLEKFSQLFAETLVEAGDNFANITTEEVKTIQNEHKENNKKQIVKYLQRENFSKEIEEWSKEGRYDGVKFVLGSTSDIIQGLGAIESDIYLLSDKINKILEDHPEMTLSEIKKIPQILEKPVLILKSLNVKKVKNNSRLIIFGTIKASNKLPVLTALDLRPVEKHLVIESMQKVVSAYTKDANPVEFIKNSDVLYADKNKTTSLLRTIGFNMPIELNESGFIGNITYDNQNVKIKGKPFSTILKDVPKQLLNSDNNVKHSERNPEHISTDIDGINISEKLSKNEMTTKEIRGIISSNLHVSSEEARYGAEGIIGLEKWLSGAFSRTDKSNYDNRGQGALYSNSKTVALGITTEFIQKGYIDFRGTKLNSNPKIAAEELATKAMILRNPKFETFRVFYTQNNTIVHQEAFTSKLVEVSTIGTENTNENIAKRMSDIMQKTGADGYYLLHNHPSGYPNPSEADINVTKFLKNNVDGFKGHVVIDHNKYSYLFDDNDSIKGYTTETTDKSVSKDYKKRIIDNPYLYQKVNSPKVLTDIAIDLVHNNDDYSAIVYTNSAGEIIGIQQVKNGFVSSNGFNNYVVNRKSEIGSRDAYIVTFSNEVYDSDLSSVMYEKNILGDVVFIDNSGYTSYVYENKRQRNGFFSNGKKESKTVRVYENESSNYSSQDAEYQNLANNPKQNKYKLQKMVDEAAKEAGYTTEHLYHGTPSFGFTDFDTNQNTDSKGIIYATNRSNVAANYGGRDKYASVREIGKKYISTPETTSDVIHNAKVVYGVDYKVATEEDKNHIYSLYHDLIQEVTDALNNSYDDEPDYSLFSEEESGKISNKIAWVKNMFYTLDSYNTIDDFVDNYSTRLDAYNSLKEDVEKYKEYIEDVKQILIDNKDNIKNKGDGSLYKLIFGYSLTDAAIDVEYKILRALSEDEMLYDSENERLDSVESVKNSTEYTHNIGSYDLYGNPGDNLLVIDANGRNWTNIISEIMEDKNSEDKNFGHSTDAIAKKAKELGYTSVLFKNIYDGGDKANEYAFFDSSQVKSADPVTYDDNGNVIPLSERFNTKNPDIRYSDREVNKGLNLIAVHGTTESKLMNALKLEGLPAISTAIINIDNGLANNGYGEISLLFDKNTIDPGKKGNSVYGSDAWTPTIKNSRQEYQIDLSNVFKVDNKINELSKTIFDGTFSSSSTLRGKLGNGDYTASDIDELTSDLASDISTKAAFVADKGVDIEPVMKPIAYHSSFSNEQLEKVLKYYTDKWYHTNYDELIELYEASYERKLTDKQKETMEKLVTIMNEDKYKDNPKRERLIQVTAKKYTNDYDAYKLIESIFKFDQEGRTLNGKNKEAKFVIDKYATEDKIKEYISQNHTEYMQWVKELVNASKVYTGENGLFNGKDRFTASGNRKSFKSTHLPYTADNIVKLLLQENSKGVGYWGVGAEGIQAITSKEYKSIDDIRKDKNRLKEVNAEEYEQILKSYSDELTELAEEIGHLNNMNLFSIEEYFQDSARGARTIESIKKSYQKYKLKITDDLASQSKKLFDEVAELPTKYFEAKANRVVDFNEIQMAVIPDNSSNELKSALDENGIPYTTYKSGNEDARVEIIRSFDNLRFSDRDQEIIEQQRRINATITKENEKLKADNENLKELVKIQRQVTNGKLFNKSSLESSANKIMKEMNAVGDKAEFVPLLKQSYDYIVNNETLDYNELREKSQPAIDWLTEHVRTKSELSDEAKSVFDYLKGKTIYISPSQKEEIAHTYGNFNNFRQPLMGRVTFTTDGSKGIALDTLMQEASSIYPELFSAETNAADLPAALYDTVISLKDTGNKLAQNEYAYARKMIAQEAMTSIYDGYWDVSTLHTVADKYQKQINALKIKHKEQVTNIREAHKEKVSKIRKQYVEDKKAALDRYRERALAKQNQIIDEYRNRIKRDKDKRKSTELRNKVKKYIEDFRQKLTNPTERKFIPAQLVKGVIDVYDAIDPTGYDQETKSAQKYQTARQALAELKLRYDELPKLDYEFSSEFSEEFSSKISDLANAVGNTPLRDMTRDQLEDVYDIIYDISAMITYATRQIGLDERITNYEAGMEIIKEMQDVKDKGLATGKVSDFFRKWTLNPLRAVREMTGFNKDSRLNSLFEALNEGRRKADTFSMESTKMFDDLRKSKADQKTFNDAVEKTYDFGIKDTEGNPLEISKMTAMALVLTWRREISNPNRNHLESPVKIPDITYEKKGDYQKAFDKGKELLVTEEVIDNIKRNLTEWDKKYMETAYSFFNRKAKDAVNETTLLTKHRPVAMEKDYIPYSVNKDYVAQENENVKFDATIEGSGVLKSVKNNANQQLVIRGLNQILDKHIDTVSKIYGLTIPIKNINKALNIKQRNEDGGRSVRDYIRRSWGELGAGPNGIISQAIADLQSPRRVESSKLFSTLKSAYVGSTLASNISVWMKQAASYPTAGAILSGSSLRRGLAEYIKIKDKESIWNEIDEHTSQHWLRRKGLSMQEIGEINQSTGWQNKLNKKLGKFSPMNWIQAMDVATTAALWEASKAEVESDGISKDNENYWSEVTKLYDRVIEETQPMYDPLHRAEITKNTAYNRVIMFQTQPIQNSGILREGAMEYRDAKLVYGKNSEEAKAALGKYKKAVASQLASHFTFTMMTLLAAAILHKMNPYRDDDDELTLESVGEEVATQYAKNIFNAMVPVFGSYAVGAFEYITGQSKYDVISDPVIDKITSTIDNFSKLKSNPSFKTFSNTAMDVASYFGIPAKNAYNIINGTKLHIEDAVNNEFGSFEAGIDRTMGQDINRAYTAYNKGDTAKTKEIIENLIQSKIEEGRERKEVISTIRSQLTQKYKTQYQEAYLNKDNEVMLEIRKFLNELNIYDDVVKTTQSWITDIKNKK